MKMVNKFKKIIFLLFIFVVISTNSCFAGVAILKSNTENGFDKFLQTFSEIDPNYKLFDETTIKTLQNTENHILIVPYSVNLTTETIQSIKSYVSSGGKLIIMAPNGMQNLSNVKTLAEIVGIKIIQVDKSKNIKCANWIEQNFNLNNVFSSSSTIAKITPQKNTEILAVWDEIEKNEPAITINQNGSYINWLWGIDGDKYFNIKSLQTIIKNLDPSIIAKEEGMLNYNDFLKKIQKISAKRKNCEKLYDILKLNKVNGRSEKLQELLELSEINEVLAQDVFFNKNYGYADQLIDNAQKCLDETYKLSLNFTPVEGRGIW
ncbi:MAG: hypothetical protein WC197_09800, partial [Candidatus Gastranaerophilaceae bacterium]